MATVTHAGTSVFTTTAGNKLCPAASGFAVALGDLIVVVAPATGVATTVITDNNPDGKGVYTKIGSSFTGFSTSGNLSIWVRNTLIGDTTATAWTATQTSSTGGGLDVYRVHGMSGFNTGSSAVRSSGGQSSAAAGTPAPVLSNTPLTGNPIITAVCSGTAPPGLTAPTGFTATVTNVSYTVPTTGFDDTFANSGITTATITWGSASATVFASIAIELDTTQFPGPVFHPAVRAIRAQVPLAQRTQGSLGRGGLVYGSVARQGAADNSFGSGRISWNSGGPPVSLGPPLSWGGPSGVRVSVVRTGVCMATLVPQVSLPVILTASLPNGTIGLPYSATLTASGGALPYTWSISSGSLPGWASLNTSTGAITGTVTGSPATTSFTVEVTDSLGHSATQPLSITTVAASAGPPAYPLQQPIQAQGIQLPRRGAARAVRFYPLPANPAQGPAFEQATTPAQARIPRNGPRGRVYSNPGAPVAVAPVVAGPPLHPQGAIRARLPQQPVLRGRVYSSRGAAVNNPAAGPFFKQATTPVRAILPSLHPRAGRVASNPGAPARNPGRGPAVYPLQGEVRSQLPLLHPRAGRVYSNAGASVRNPVQGTSFIPFRQPVQAQRPLPARGRVYSNPGGPVQNPPPTGVGPPFYPYRTPVRVHLSLPPHGRVYSNKGAPVRNPAQGPVFRQASSPVQAKHPLPSRGRIAGNIGAPVNNPQPEGTGPVFFPIRFPARARILVNAPRGRVYFNPGAPVKNPAAGPVFVQAVKPAHVRIPQVFSRGRVYSNPGGVPVSLGPKVYPAKGPVQARKPLPPRGRVYSNPGGLSVSIGPAFIQAVRPVQARKPLPPKGRVASNPGIKVLPPVIPAPIFPLHGPVQARRPLPPRGRVASNRGALVKNPVNGPRFIQAVQPARVRIPQNAPRGRTSSNPGGPVENIPLTAPLIKLGVPYLEWIVGQPHGEWAAGEPFPYSDWITGEPFLDWLTGTPYQEWDIGEPYGS